MDTSAQTWKIELHALESLTLSDAQFLTGSGQGRPVRLGAVLRIPTPGVSRMPAIVLMHGSGGASGYTDDWARYLNTLGVATLLIDSFTGRGLDTTFASPDSLGRLAMIVDAYRAFDLLAAHPRIDSGRIALMGFSRGGQATLYSAVERFHRLHGASGRFAMHIALYPACHTRFIDDTIVTDRPIHVLHGTDDDMNPIEPCRDYVARVRATGAKIQLHELSGAQHVFDWPLLARPLVLHGVRSNKGVLLEERAPGDIVPATGQGENAFTIGPTFAYQPAAFERARAIVRSAILEELLRR